MIPSYYVNVGFEFVECLLKCYLFSLSDEDSEDDEPNDEPNASSIISSVTLSHGNTDRLAILFIHWHRCIYVCVCVGVHLVFL